MAELSESEAADEQEALSIRYVCGLRLLLLSSGHWAIFHSGEQGFGQLTVQENLDLGWLQELGVKEMLSRAIERFRTETQTVVSPKNLEEMGL